MYSPKSASTVADERHCGSRGGAGQCRGDLRNGLLQRLRAQGVEEQLGDLAGLLVEREMPCVRDLEDRHVGVLGEYVPLVVGDCDVVPLAEDDPGGDVGITEARRK